MQRTIHTLTDKELVMQLQDRNDLTGIEHELLDRFIRALDVIEDLERMVPACGEPIPQELVT